MAKTGSRVLQAASLACLLLLASSALPPALGGKRDGPFRLREHLWATGHFMGKKSTLGPSFQWWSPSLKRAEPENIPGASNPVTAAVLEEVKDQLRQGLLTTFLQWSLAEENQEKKKEQGKKKEQEISSLRKLLAKYI